MTIADLRIFNFILNQEVKFEMINSSDKIIGKVEYCINTKKINETIAFSFKLIFMNLFPLTYAIALVDI
jgi:hypothetical protein